MKHSELTTKPDFIIPDKMVKIYPKWYMGDAIMALIDREFDTHAKRQMRFKKEEEV